MSDCTDVAFMTAIDNIVGGCALNEIKPDMLVSSLFKVINRITDTVSLRQVLECALVEIMIMRAGSEMSDSLAGYLHTMKREDAVQRAIGCIALPLANLMEVKSAVLMDYAKYYSAIRPLEGAVMPELTSSGCAEQVPLEPVIHTPRFMNSKTPISRHVYHHYSHTPLVTSKPMANGSTYTQLFPDVTVLQEFAKAIENCGIYDRVNHAYLVSADTENNDIKPFYKGRRLTITKLSNTELLMVAMQVVSGRRSCNPGYQVDLTFQFMKKLCAGEICICRELPYPSCITGVQQLELIHAYVVAHVLADTAVDDTARRAAREILEFWFHCGARVTYTKQVGWMQNPQRKRKRSPSQIE